MAQFGKQAEDQLIGWMRQVQGHVTGGAHPTEAIIKVAKDNQVPSDTLPLMVQAYNTGRQTFQRDKCGAKGEGILCKLADFPIASIEEVREALYPAKVAAAVTVSDPGVVSPQYSRPPTPFQHEVLAAREKVASASVRMSNPPEPLAGEDPDIKMARVFNTKERLDRRMKQAQQDSRCARNDFLLALGRLGDYFKQAEYSRLPLQEVGFNAIAMFGKAAGDALAYVADRNGVPTPDFTKAPKIARPVQQDAAPYSLVKSAIVCCGTAITAAKQAQEAEKQATAEQEELMRPFAPALAPVPTSVLDSPDTWGSKQAAGGLLGGLIGGSAAGASRGLFAPKPTSELIGDTELELSDPAHMDELKRIESKAVLNDLLANDEVVSGYDPNEVSEAYNEIIATSPSLATQPLALRPMLRKRLTAGTMEPFEAQQAAEMEKTIRQTEQGGKVNEQAGTPVLV